MSFKRFEPKAGDDIDQLLAHQELLIMLGNRLLDYLRKSASLHYSKSEMMRLSIQKPSVHRQIMEARELLREFGEGKAE